MSLNTQKMERRNKMNRTTQKLVKGLPNNRYLGPDDPIYSEPPGILFTGGTREPVKKAKTTKSKRKEKKNG